MDATVQSSRRRGRALGPLEQYSYVRSQLGIYNNVCVTASFKRQTSEPLRPALFRALGAVVAKHPSLSAVPVGETSAPYFTLLPTIDAEKVVTFVERESDTSENALPYSDLDEIVRAQHNTPFRHETPLQPFWRVAVVEYTDDTYAFTLCFCFHHALADTRSGVVFLQDLEYALSNPGSASPFGILVSSNSELIPSMETLHEFPLTPEYIAKQQTPTQISPDTWSGQPQAVPVSTNFTSLWIPESQTRGLVEVSRENGSSLTGALMALLSTACFTVLPPNYTKINGECAISLRDFLPTPVCSSSIGCYVGSFGQSYDRTKTSVWEDARRTKEIIRGILANGAPDIPATYLKNIPDMEAWFTGKMGQKRSSAWEISNVGPLVKLEGENQQYKMGSLLFSQSASACSGAIKVSVATGRDGRLSLGFTWQRGIVEDSMVHEVVRNIGESIQQITDTS